MTTSTHSHSIDPGVRIGHVHLKVADLERALRFYCGVLGFELTQRLGSPAAVGSAGGYHTTSASTPGRASADHGHRQGRRASTTRRSSTRPGERSPGHYVVFWKQASLSKEPAITE
jgi:catechol-2,3-dioxygenase